MTRKDYILIAKAITDTQKRIVQAESIPQPKREEQLRGVRRVAAHLADALAADNPRGFDPALFLKNCGYGGTEAARRAHNGFSAASAEPGGTKRMDVERAPGAVERPTALNLSALERAYDEGRAAFVSGMPCPYNIATAEHAQFMSGRHAALVEHERATKKGERA